mgnify:CR=1 FL=1
MKNVKVILWGLGAMGGGIGKMFGRMFSGESMFVNEYTAQNGPGMIAFASSFPGSIRAFQITPGNDLICQKSAFLASEVGVELSMHFQTRSRLFRRRRIHNAETFR